MFCLLLFWVVGYSILSVTGCTFVFNSPYVSFTEHSSNFLVGYLCLVLHCLYYVIRLFMEVKIL